MKWWQIVSYLVANILFLAAAMIGSSILSSNSAEEIIAGQFFVASVIVFFSTVAWGEALR